MHLYWDRLLWTMQLKMTLNLWSSYIYLPSTGIPGLCQYSCLLQCWEWKSGPSYTDSHSTKWATSIALAQWFKRRHLWVAEAACRHSCIPVHVFMHTSNLSSRLQILYHIIIGEICSQEPLQGQELKFAYRLATVECADENVILSTHVLKDTRWRQTVSINMGGLPAVDTGCIQKPCLHML